jgi:hypothetical protein
MPKVVPVLQYLFMALMLSCLAILAVRATFRLEGRWDTPLYHLPFAAAYGGLDIAYTLSERISLAFQGFPPLAHIVQGALWRLTGSVNATGVVNFLAFAALLAISQRKFRAPFYLLAAIALTAPLVLIHLTSSYVDLFGNSWLALGILCLFNAYYFERTSDQSLLWIGLAGLVAAAWTKFQLTPAVAIFLLLYLAVYWPRPFRREDPRSRAMLWITFAGLVAAVPYIKNWILYGSPFWPVPIPLLQDYLPYSDDFLQPLPWANSPPPLHGESQSIKFIHSLFEIGHPHEYPHRARWIIDQGNAWLAFRSGGFWNYAVVCYLLMAATLAAWLNPRKGVPVCVVSLLLLLLVSAFPQSHELRYYLFIPLAWAGVIASLYSHVRQRSGTAALLVLVTVLGLFLYVSRINFQYFQVERSGYAELARGWGADQYWPEMTAGVQYCAVDMAPIGFLLTGPTMREFTVVDRRLPENCPAGSVQLLAAPATAAGSSLMNQALELIYQEGNYPAALVILGQILGENPQHFGAMWQRAEALERAGNTDAAIDAWRVVVAEAASQGYLEEAEARQRLEGLQ